MSGCVWPLGTDWYISQTNVLKLHLCCSMWHDLLLFKGWIIFHCTYITRFVTHSFTDWHLSCFHLLAFGIMLRWTWVCQYLLQILFLIVLGRYPEVGLRDYMGALFLIFWGTIILFSTVVVPFYIPATSAWSFPFLHTLSKTCYFLFFSNSRVFFLYFDIFPHFFCTLTNHYFYNQETHNKRNVKDMGEWPDIVCNKFIRTKALN